jgi:tRNA dimethylallyltransferase
MEIENLNLVRQQSLPLVIIQGPTASGKSKLAIHLAARFNGEIINADSMQVYRHLDIGTDKSTVADRQGIPHHLLDIVDPRDSYTAGDFARNAAEAANGVVERKRLPLLVGGTPFYIRALLLGLCDMPVPIGRLRAIRQKLQRLRDRFSGDYFYRWASRVDPAAMRTISVNDSYRVGRVLEVFYTTGKRLSHFHSLQRFAPKATPYHILRIGLSMPRDILYQRINCRVEWMVENGWVGEMRQLLEMGYSPDLKSLRTLGYKWMVRHVLGELSLEQAISLTQRDTRHFAKRQLTWLKKDLEIRWLDAQSGPELAEKWVTEFLAERAIYSKAE